MSDEGDSAASARGFAWPQQTWLYHATTGMRRLVEEGFKTREQLGGAHALGGGPDNGVSFALDKRVTRSIAVGLNTLRRAARWELGIGDLIVQAQTVAPKGLKGLLETIRVEPEDVVRLDRGLIRVARRGYVSGGNGYFGVERLDNDQWDKLLPVIEYVEEHFADGAKSPYLVVGWAPTVDVIRVKPDAWARDKTFNENFAESYKTLLAHADGARELYNPVFWATSMGALAERDEADLGIVRCRVRADWVCADWKSAEEAGFEPQEQIRHRDISDWSNACDVHLGRTVRAQTRGEEEPGWSSSPYTVAGTKWDAPDPTNTIAYRGSLTEIRVYDPRMITDLEIFETMDEVRMEIGTDFFNKGIDVDDPYANPWIRNVTPRLR